MTKPDMAPASSALDLHATGKPDTPVECVQELLQTALKQTRLEDAHALVQQALDIVAGEQLWSFNAGDHSQSGGSVLISITVRCCRLGPLPGAAQQPAAPGRAGADQSVFGT